MLNDLWTPNAWVNPKYHNLLAHTFILREVFCSLTHLWEFCGYLVRPITKGSDVNVYGVGLPFIEGGYNLVYYIYF